MDGVAYSLFYDQEHCTLGTAKLPVCRLYSVLCHSWTTQQLHILMLLLAYMSPSKLAMYSIFTVLNPSSVPARNTLTAISPRLAHRIFENGVSSDSSI